MSLEVDYLVIGGGAMGMAFADVIVNESEATVAIVDRRDRPGGHWNTAYPFVRLHQPSAFYGVNSRKLGNDTVDQVGWNAGLYELASGSEVLAYFDQVMREQFLPTGRVHYFPNCEYSADGAITSNVSGESHDVKARQVVDATYMNVTVPSMRPPAYAVDEGVECVPLNALPTVAKPGKRYFVIGAGKTGMDACLWLLARGVAPSDIAWVMPRDSWLLDRAGIQPGELAANAAMVFGQQLKIAAESESMEDVFVRINEAGGLLRFSDDVWPTMYRCATVTQPELEQLRRIENVIRKGRVQQVHSDRVVLDEGEVAVAANTVFVDCSADGLERLPVTPVFAGNTITLQPVRVCQQVFSAAFIAHVQLNYADDETKNQLCTVIPHPDNHIDFLRTTLANTINSMTWGQYPELQEWLKDARLDGFSARGRGSDNVDEGMAAIGMQAVEKLQRYIAEAQAEGL